MSDPFLGYAPGLDSPAEDGFDITPNDGADLATVPRSVYIGTGGDLKVDTKRGTTLTFTGLPDGFILPLRVKKVYLTGTTAVGIIGLY